MTKTTNYQLPKWEKTDRVQMKDFNDMTATLDAALHGHAVSAEAAQASRDLTGARPEYLQSVLDRIDRDFGGMDAFLRQEMGLDAEKLRLLRDMYLMN